MTGQTKLSSTKQNIVEDFISRVNPYEKITPLHFDLRGYSEFIKANHISADNVTSDIMNPYEKITPLNFDL